MDLALGSLGRPSKTLSLFVGSLVLTIVAASAYMILAAQDDINFREDVKSELLFLKERAGAPASQNVTVIESGNVTVIIPNASKSQTPKILLDPSVGGVASFHDPIVIH